MRSGKSSMVKSRNRPTKIQYFLDLARVVASRGTCDRAHVGCVLVRDDRVIATGYNGAPAHLPHCDEVGHEMDGGHCIRTIHAEENAIIQCAVHGVSTKGAWCYCTFIPCVRCAQRLLSAGIDAVIYEDYYGDWSSTYARHMIAIGRHMAISRWVRQSGKLIAPKYER